MSKNTKIFIWQHRWNMLSPVIFAGALTIFAGALPPWAPPWWRGCWMWNCKLVADVGQWYIAYGVWNQKLFECIESTKLTAFSLNVELVFSEFYDFRPNNTAVDP